MQLKSLTVSEYIDVLFSDAPAPGGGSASALCGAQGVALTAMVAGLTLGRKKYECEQGLCSDVVSACISLKDALIAQIDRDTEAYNQVMAAFKLPKTTDEEISARTDAIARASLLATEVPYDTMDLSVKALRLARTLVGHSNINAASDLGVAALNLLSCTKGAWLNVRINLSGLSAEHAARFKEDGEKLVQEAEALAKEMYDAVICCM